MNVKDDNATNDDNETPVSKKDGRSEWTPERRKAQSERMKALRAKPKKKFRRVKAKAKVKRTSIPLSAIPDAPPKRQRKRTRTKPIDVDAELKLEVVKLLRKLIGD